MALSGDGSTFPVEYLTSTRTVGNAFPNGQVFKDILTKYNIQDLGQPLAWAKADPTELYNYKLAKAKFQALDPCEAQLPCCCCCWLICCPCTAYSSLTQWNDAEITVKFQMETEKTHLLALFPEALVWLQLWPAFEGDESDVQGQFQARLEYEEYEAKGNLTPHYRMFHPIRDVKGVKAVNDPTAWARFGVNGCCYDCIMGDASQIDAMLMYAGAWNGDKRTQLRFTGGDRDHYSNYETVEIPTNWPIINKPENMVRAVHKAINDYENGKTGNADAPNAVVGPPPAFDEIQDGNTASAPPAGNKTVADQIQELVDLKNQGLLTEEEFTAAKAKALGM